MDITLNPGINGSYLFKGISGRADIDRVAQTLSTGVAERFEASAQTELEAPVAALQSKFTAQGLTPAQTASALFLSGALLGGSLGPITARAAREALTQPQVADTLADQATALVKNQHSDTLDTVALAFADAPVGLVLAGALREEMVTGELAAWATSPSNPQSGLACGSFLRPDPLFSGRTQLVVNTFKSPGNPDGLEEVAAGKANIINIRQLFSGNDEMAIGFGKPNVFTVIPGAKGKYEKLDAFMFFRKKARVASAEVVQSGECWGERIVKPDGKPGIRLHINNNSGTYRPTDAQIKAAAKYLAALFDCEVVCHPVGEEPASLKTDDQKTYEVPAAKFDALKASLHGQRFTLKDAQGNPQEFVARRFGSRTLDTEYFDTPQHDLLQGDGMLRARSTIKDGEVKEVEVESKVRDAQGTTWRAKGQKADSAKWDTKRAKVLGVGSADPAVVHARTVTGLSSQYQPTAWKNVERELFLVSPTGLFGRLKPSFVISLDTNSVRDTAAGPGGPKYHSVDPQIFTKVPWMKEIDEDRKAQFGDLCAQLSGQNGLTEVTQTAYQETMEHLKAQQG
ncbi:MAG: hypothetical protein AMXMBFR33_06020 [Candidatus Xenobia bacterium]